MRPIMPKTIANHPGVEEVLDGESEGFDYRYHVWLKEGWAFRRGRMAGCRTGNFQTVAGFRFANPVRTEG
jgi:hypothetical protein